MECGAVCLVCEVKIDRENDGGGWICAERCSAIQSSMLTERGCGQIAQKTSTKRMFRLRLGERLYALDAIDDVIVRVAKYSCV